MSPDGYKEVRFDKFCMQCEYYGTPETKDPCYHCLAYPMNTYSEKPLRFKERNS